MRVLLIEDDSATAQSIELMLKSESFNVYTTDLGEEGVDLGKLYDYDIILLDLNLPDMSGYEVLRTLRLSKVKTPILILSGMAVAAPGRGADRNEDDIACGNARLYISSEGEAAGSHIVGNELFEARLEDRYFAALESLNLARILIDADDLMAEIGKADTRYKPYIT